jgi:1-acyl-sn-glycerol-3-phosphate acyltransferase
MLDQGRNSIGVRLLRGSLLLLMRVLFRIEHRGMENVPMNGPLIVVANHTTYCDPFWISVRIHRALRFMAWDKIFEFPISGTLFRWLGAFPISLENPETTALKTSLKVLRAGEALMIFPEAGRSPDGNLLPFKQGAAHLALKLGIPILPTVIHGGVKVWGPRMVFPMPGKVRVEYLPAITPDRFENTAAGLTRQIREAIESRLNRDLKIETADARR